MPILSPRQGQLIHSSLNNLYYSLQPLGLKLRGKLKSQTLTSDSRHKFQLNYLHQMSRMNQPILPPPYWISPPLRTINQNCLHYLRIQQHLIHQQWSNQFPTHLYASHHIHCRHAYLRADGSPCVFLNDRRTS